LKGPSSFFAGSSAAILLGCRRRGDPGDFVLRRGDPELRLQGGDPRVEVGDLLLHGLLRLLQLLARAHELLKLLLDRLTLLDIGWRRRSRLRVRHAGRQHQKRQQKAAAVEAGHSPLPFPLHHVRRE